MTTTTAAKRISKNVTSSANPSPIEHGSPEMKELYSMSFSKLLANRSVAGSPKICSDGSSEHQYSDGTVVRVSNNGADFKLIVTSPIDVSAPLGQKAKIGSDGKPVVKYSGTVTAELEKLRGELNTVTITASDSEFEYSLVAHENKDGSYAFQVFRNNGTGVAVEVKGPKVKEVAEALLPIGLRILKDGPAQTEKPKAAVIANSTDSAEPFDYSSTLKFHQKKIDPENLAALLWHLRQENNSRDFRPLFPLERTPHFSPPLYRKDRTPILDFALNEFTKGFGPDFEPK